MTLVVSVIGVVCLLGWFVSIFLWTSERHSSWNPIACCVIIRPSIHAALRW